MSLNIYEYDAVGRLVRVIARFANGDDRTVETYEYDPDGLKRKTIYVHVHSQNPDTQYAWDVEGTDTYYSAPGAATLKALYNECEQPTHLLFYDATDRLLSRVEFSYDTNANLIQETQTNTADTLPAEMLTAMNAPQIETLRRMLGAAGEPVRRMHRYDGGSGANSERAIGHLKESLVASGGQHSVPNVWSSSESGRQLSRLGLLFSNFLRKLDSANRYRGGLESLEPEHRPYPLFDSAMVLLDNIVQVSTGAYPNTAQ